MKKSIKKLKLSRESIRTLSLEHQLPLVAGGKSGQFTCVGCEESGIVMCTPEV
jgi:hypothetical protein